MAKCSMRKKIESLKKKKSEALYTADDLERDAMNLKVSGHIEELEKHFKTLGPSDKVFIEALVRLNMPYTYDTPNRRIYIKKLELASGSCIVVNYELNEYAEKAQTISIDARTADYKRPVNYIPLTHTYSKDVNSCMKAIQRAIDLAQNAYDALQAD